MGTAGGAITVLPGTEDNAKFCGDKWPELSQLRRRRQAGSKRFQRTTDRSAGTGRRSTTRKKNLRRFSEARLWPKGSKGSQSRRYNSCPAPEKIFRFSTAIPLMLVDQP
jgi:hypothetical protein